MLVYFIGEVWCFWIEGNANNIAFTKTNLTGWDAMRIVDDSVPPFLNDNSGGPVVVTRYRVEPVGGPSGQPLMAVAAAGADLHLVFTATKKGGDKHLPLLRHLIYKAETGTWELSGDVPADEVSSGLNLMSNGDTLGVAWLDAKGTRFGAVRQGDDWVKIQMPNHDSGAHGAAIATFSEGPLFHLLTYGSQGHLKLLDYVIDIRSDKPPKPTTLQDSIPDAFSASALSACNFQEFIFWVLYNPSTKGFKVMESNGQKKLKEHTGLDGTADMIPAILVAKNKIYCVWLDSQKKGLLFSLVSAVVMPARMNEWMTALPDKVPKRSPGGNTEMRDMLISELTIPGTHDSGAISYVPYVGCQMMTFRQQLENGIRYFDLRAGYGFRGNRPEPVIHHAFFRIFAKTVGSSMWNIPSYFDDLRVADVFNVFYDFLAQNPGEGIIVQVKRDDFNIEGKVHEQDDLVRFANDIWGLIHIPGAQGRWLFANRIPALREIRGKIQLVRRFIDGMPSPDIRPEERKTSYGIPVSSVWPENAQLERFQSSINFAFQLQDYFDLSWQTTGTKPALAKWNAILPMLNMAWQAVQQARGRGDGPDGTTPDWYLNFSSGVQKPPMSLLVGGQAHTIATGFWHISWLPIISPYGVNANLVDYFSDANRQKGGYGTIIMDFPEQPVDLIPALVRTNFPQ